MMKSLVFQAVFLPSSNQSSMDSSNCGKRDWKLCQSFLTNTGINILNLNHHTHSQRKSRLFPNAGHFSMIIIFAFGVYLSSKQYLNLVRQAFDGLLDC